jgi:hypothetical protein
MKRSLTAFHLYCHAPWPIVLFNMPNRSALQEVARTTELRAPARRVLVARWEGHLGPAWADAAAGRSLPGWNGLQSCLMKSAPSTFARGVCPSTFAKRIEPHIKGELTLDQAEPEDQATTLSTVPYLERKPREFQDTGCFGRQSSPSLHDETLEVVRHSSSAARTRLIRRPGKRRHELVEIPKQRADGRRGQREPHTPRGKLQIAAHSSVLSGDITCPLG